MPGFLDAIFHIPFLLDSMNASTTHAGKFVPGCYAISISGSLSEELLVSLCRVWKGVIAFPMDDTTRITSPFMWFFTILSARHELPWLGRSNVL